ncbi:MAG: GntR family transcriptional regulator [Candidatus Eisenbacteria bacterium]|nr:GntR family transcriptional regulator [Candidatus Eisenbacteria bacterium]
MGTIRDAILTGAVAPGHSLPSARQLGGDLGVHWNTVARAYRELADDGFVYVVRGRRAVVRPRSHWIETGRGKARLDANSHLAEAVARARVAGLSDDELRAALEEAIRTPEERR